MECNAILNINETSSNQKFMLKSNWVRDEFTFSASDNDDAPESPILLQIECYMITNIEWIIIKSQPHGSGSVDSGMNWPSVLLIMMMLLNHQYCYKCHMIWLKTINEL